MIHREMTPLNRSGPIGEVSDQQLLQRFIDHRDEAAFLGLMQRHGKTVWGVCRRVLRQEQDAEDVFQAVFLVLARKAASIRKGEAVGSWLYGVAYRIARRARHKTESRQDGEKQVRAARGEPPPWSEAAFRELQRLLDDEVQCLSERYRAPFVLCCLEGMSRAEAARELGCNEGTLSARLARARKLLRSRLSRRGVSLTAILTATALSASAAVAAPAALLQATAQAVLASLAGNTVSALSPSVLALAESAPRTLALGLLKATLTLVLALTTLVAGAHLAAPALAPAADEVAWQPRPWPAGWAEQHEELAMLAEQPAAEAASDVPAPDKAVRADKPAGVPKPKGAYRAHYERSFQGNPEKGPDLGLFGLDADQGVRFEPAGLRIVLPPGYPDERPRTGVATSFGVQGDFDIMLRYEILQEPAGDEAAKQTRLTLAIPLAAPKPHLATLSRTVVPGQGPRFLTWLTRWDPTAAREQLQMKLHPARAKAGRLRLVRSGSILYYFVAEGVEGEFTLLDQWLAGDVDLPAVRIVGSTGGVKAGLDVRITELHIFADSFRDAPSAPARPARRKSWLALALAFFLALLLAGTFSFNKKRERSADKRHMTAADDSSNRARRRLHRWKLTTVLLALAVTLVGMSVLYFRRDRSESARALPDADAPTPFVNRVLGATVVPGVEEAGLWHTEFTKKSGEPFRWTNGAARLVVPLWEGPPQALQVRLGVPIPRPVKRLCIQVNGQAVFDEPLAMPFEWSRTFDLSKRSLGQEAVIDIISDTFVPTQHDERTLGVCVRGITLVRNAPELPQ
jgi:RNA polymerase sigma factor (sigma-70 family)